MSAAFAHPLDVNDDARDSLDAHLDAGVSLPRDDHDKPYVDSDDQADWALRKVARLREQLARVDDLADARIAQVEEWRKAESEKPQGSLHFFLHLLSDFHARQLEADPKATSVALPSGTLRSRKVSAKVEVTDTATLVAWLEDTFDADDLDDLLLAPKPRSPSRKALKDRLGDVLLPGPDGALVTPDGERVPGAAHVAESRTFTVEEAS